VFHNITTILIVVFIVGNHNLVTIHPEYVLFYLRFYHCSYYFSNYYSIIFFNALKYFVVLYTNKKKEDYLLIKNTLSLKEEVPPVVSLTHQINKRVKLEDPLDARFPW